MRCVFTCGIVVLVACSEPPPAPPVVPPVVVEKPEKLDERAMKLAEEKFRAEEEARTHDPNVQPVSLSQLFPLVERKDRSITARYLDPDVAKSLKPGVGTGLLFTRGEKSVAFVGAAQCQQNEVAGGSILAGTGMKSIQFSVDGELFDPKTKAVLGPLRAQKNGLGISVAIGCEMALKQGGDALGEDFVAKLLRHL